MIARTVCALVLVIGLAGCKKDAGAAGGGAGGGGGGDPSLVEQFTTKSLKAIQDLVPAEGPKLEFEAKTLDDGVVGAVPKGWKIGVIPGKFGPPDDANLGFLTSYSLSANCDGDCAAKDWKAVAQKVEFAQFEGDNFEIVEQQDLAAPAGRMVVAKPKGEARVYVAVARWKDGAPRYLTCRVTLEQAAAPLQPALQKACLEATASFLQ